MSKLATVRIVNGTNTTRAHVVAGNGRVVGETDVVPFGFAARAAELGRKLARQLGYHPVTHYAVLTDVGPSRATVVRVCEGECPAHHRLAVPVECDSVPVEGERVWVRRDGFGVAAVCGRA